jgi:hypothetical protein
MLTTKAHVAVALIVAASGLGASGDAMAAAACYNGTGYFAPASTDTMPVVTTCEFPDPLTTGPGTALLAQDQSAAETFNTTYAFTATSINNSAIYAYAEAGSTNAIYAVSPGTGGATSGYATIYGNATSAGGNGVLGSGYNAGVYGYSTVGDGVYGNGDLYGVYGIASGGDGVYGHGITGHNAVTGANVGSGWGVGASSVSGTALNAANSSNSFAAVNAINSGSGDGIYASSTGGYGGEFIGTGVETNGKYYQSGLCVAGCVSDERLKKNIAPLKGALDALLKLRGVTFEWKDPKAQGPNQGVTQTGFIAQEVEKLHPEWVGHDDKGFRTLTLQPSQIGALEVESIRALKIENDELRTRTAKLEDRLDALQNGRDPVTGGVGFGRGALLLVGLGVAGAFGISRRRRGEK